MHRLSSCRVPRLSCSAICGIFPDQGQNQYLLHHNVDSISGTPESLEIPVLSFTSCVTLSKLPHILVPRFQNVITNIYFIGFLSGLCECGWQMGIVTINNYHHHQSCLLVFLLRLPSLRVCLFSIAYWQNTSPGSSKVKSESVSCSVMSDCVTSGL